MEESGGLNPLNVWFRVPPPAPSTARLHGQIGKVAVFRSQSFPGSTPGGAPFLEDEYYEYQKHFRSSFRRHASTTD